MKQISELAHPWIIIIIQRHTFICFVFTSCSYDELRFRIPDTIGLIYFYASSSSLLKNTIIACFRPRNQILYTSLVET